MTDLVSLIHDAIKADAAFSEVVEFNKANGFISTKQSGISVGLDQERYEPGNRGYDEVGASIRIVCWIKDKDQARGEAKIRELSHEIRRCLAQDENRTLEGRVIGGFVREIEYLTADAGNSLLLHMSEIMYEIDYVEERLRPSNAPTVIGLYHDVDVSIGLEKE